MEAIPTRLITAITRLSARNQTVGRGGALFTGLTKAVCNTLVVLARVPPPENFLNNLPTSLQLDDEDLDKLIATARMLLRHEPAFERFLQRNDGKRSADTMSDDEICRYFSHERCR